MLAHWAQWPVSWKFCQAKPDMISVFPPSRFHNSIVFFCRVNLDKEAIVGLTPLIGLKPVLCSWIGSNSIPVCKERGINTGWFNHRDCFNIPPHTRFSTIMKKAKESNKGSNLDEDFREQKLWLAPWHILISVLKASHWIWIICLFVAFLQTWLSDLRFVKKFTKLNFWAKNFSH